MPAPINPVRIIEVHVDGYPALSPVFQTLTRAVAAAPEYAAALVIVRRQPEEPGMRQPEIRITYDNQTEATAPANAEVAHVRRILDVVLGAPREAQS